MKRLIFLFALIAVWATHAFAYDFEVDGLYYYRNGWSVQVVYHISYSSLNGELDIPSSVKYNGNTFSVVWIGYGAFKDCSGLTSVTIPNSVTSIGESAFSGCSGLTSVTIGDSVTSIGSSAFSGCSGLTSVTIGDSVTSIGSSAFSGCSGLTSVTIPNSVTSIGGSAFYGCSGLKTVNWNAMNCADFTQASNAPFYGITQITSFNFGNIVRTIPAYLCYGLNGLTSVAIPNSVTSIGKSAFSGCSGLTSVTIPNSVTWIGSYAFDGCSGLTSVAIGESVTSIGMEAFSGCSGLTSVTIPNSVTSIGGSAFYGCSGLKTVNWNAMNCADFTQASNAPFYGITQITSFNFGNIVRTIPAYLCYGLNGLTSVAIPNSVTSIGNSAFYGCNNITALTWNATDCHSNGSMPTINLTDVSIGSEVQTLPYCFVSGSKITSISIPSSVKTIENRAFMNCTSLESITIPASVTKIGTTTNNELDLPLYGCTGIKKVVFEDGSKQISLSCYCNSSGSGKGLFSSCPLEEVHVGRNITYENYNTEFPYRFGYSAFYDKPNLTKITIGDSVTVIPDYLLYNNSSITLSTLPHVKKIGKHAFDSCSRLTTLNLGDAIETVDDYAFSGCPNITKLTFPNTTKTIGNYAFYNCSSVAEITVGTGLETIGAYAFYGCKSFTALILPDQFSSMGESAFEGCEKLTVARLGESLTAVPAKAFKNCPALSEMSVPATAESIGDQAFYNDSGLATISMKEGLKTIGNEVFWNNSGIMSFTIPGTVTSMGSNCFYGCTRVMYLTFSDGEQTLNINNENCRSSKVDAATSDNNYRNRYYDYFYDCPIRFVTLGRNITYKYTDSQSIYDIEQGKYVTRASAPFYNASDLRAVTIGPKVRFLYNHLFDNCDKITSINLPARLSSIGNYAFANCDILATTNYNEATDHTLSIHDYSFSNCPLLTAVELPCQLNKLGNNTFENCISLSSVIFNETENYTPELTIGDYTFAYCDKISSLTFPGRLKSIGNYTFKRCDSLVEVSFLDSSNAVTLGYGAQNSSTSSDSSSMPLFGNSNLEKLYLGRNVDYNASLTYGYSPFYKQESLTDVQFSQKGTVTYCKDYLLYYVNNCDELVLPESLVEIGSYTFARMHKLQGITIPNNVTSIGKYAFLYDSTLKNARLSTSCEWLKEGVFSGCSSLEAITIPPCVTKMDTKLFANCSSLATVKFEGSSELLVMGYGASNSLSGLFSDCPIETLELDRWLSYNTDDPIRSPFYSIEELKNLTFGENVQVVDKYMFSYCTGLESVVLPDNITSVGFWGFRGCSSLKNVQFSQRLSQVGDYGFSECTSLDNVVFPASMTSISDNSFSNCTSLKNLDLGSSLMIIGPSAFMNDVALEGIEIPESLYGLGVEAFKGCESLPNVTIRSITSVGARAFQNCTGLRWVSLSDKTTSLGEDSFAGCTGISYVRSYADIPPEGLVNFAENVPENGTLYVPQNSIMYYQYSPTWENWLDIRALSENILVSSISLNENEISLLPTGTKQLSVCVGNDDATDKDVIWKSSNEEVATVDNSGLVMAISVGEAIITALAADGSGLKDECHVTVKYGVNAPVFEPDGGEFGNEVTVIISADDGAEIHYTLDGTEPNAESTLYTEPFTLTETTTVKAIAFKDGMASEVVSTEYVITGVIPGDVNDDGKVNVMDIVETVSYIMGSPSASFVFAAADLDGNGTVNVMDLVNLVEMIMTSANQAAAKSSAKELMTVDCVELVNAGKNTVSVAFPGTEKFVAAQFTVELKNGNTLNDVTTDGNHRASFTEIGEGKYMVLVYSPDNSMFEGDEAIRLSVNNGKNVTIDNAVLVDVDKNAVTCNAVSSDNSCGVISIEADFSRPVDIYNLNGQLVRKNATSTKGLDKGFYIINNNKIYLR